MSLLRTAVNLINRHGIDCTYKVIVEGVYNVATRTVTNTSTEITLKAFRLIQNTKDTSSPNLVSKNDSTVLLAGLEAEAKGVIPKVGDIIVYDSEELEVKVVMKHWALGKVSLYRLIVTR